MTPRQRFENYQNKKNLQCFPHRQTYTAGTMPKSNYTGNVRVAMGGGQTREVLLTIFLTSLSVAWHFNFFSSMLFR